MDERICLFLKELEDKLSELPDEEVKKAVNFYEEYLNEAAESGKDIGDVLDKLGSPDMIAGMIKTEISITKAELRPDLRNFTKASRNAFKSVTTPLSLFFLAMVEIVTFCMVVIFLGCSFACASGAFAGGFVLIYEAARMPSKYTVEIIGTIGAAAFLAGVLILVAYFFYKCGRFFVRVSAGLVREILKKSGKPMPEPAGTENGRNRKNRRFVAVSAIIAAVGLMLFGLSGIPLKYFTIFNSMKPLGSIAEVRAEYDAGAVKGISVISLNSVIRIKKGSPDNKITVLYEKPEWLTHEIGCNSGILTFSEKSSGMLPLYSVAAIHEGLTEIQVIVPEAFNPSSVMLESMGGHVFLSGLGDSVLVKTLNGSVNLSFDGEDRGVGVKASTKTGKISVNGMDAGVEMNGAIQYRKDVPSGKTVEITSNSGNINIDY